MTIETDSELPPGASKPYPLPLKHHKFIKEEIENSLKAEPIERSISPYATTIIIDPTNHKTGAPLVETKRLVIDY